MSKYKLAISIPTYERPECVSELVDHIISEADKLNIGVYVFDGSISDETKKVCEKYKEYSCFNYIKQIGEMKERHWEAVIATDCEYLWVCRDRSIIKPEFYGIILQILEEKYDIFIVTDITNTISKRIHLINSPSELFKEYLLSMTFFGSYIIKKEILNNTDSNIEAKYYTYFALLSKVFKSIVKIKNFKALFIPFDNNYNRFVIPNNIEYNSEQLFDIWGYSWIKMIDDLPTYYDELKEKAKHVRDVDYWKLENILDLRKHGSINLKSVLKNSAIVKQVSSTPLIVFIIVSLIPKFFAKPIYKLTMPFLYIFNYIHSKINKNINIIKKKLNHQKSL